MYARLHEQLTEQPMRVTAIGLILAQVLGILLVIAIALRDEWHLILFQVAGIASVYAGLRLYEAGRGGHRFLIYAGALPLIFFLYYVFAPLGALALIVWGIVFLVSIVT